MKPLYILLLSMILAYQATEAQCPGCVPYDCSASNPDGGLCDTILIGMANHPLDQQISFYMPKQVYTTLLPGGGYVTLDKIKITGVVGLPLGLNWESNKSPNNEYFPSSGDTIGCVRMCGVPLQADTFPLTVYLLADVTAPVVGQVKNQSQTYSNAVVIILPDTAGGVSSFTITPNISTSCDPLTLSFDAKIDGAPNPTVYSWDFGNGNTGTGKTPGSQTFSAPGTYPVTLTTTIMNYKITQFQVSSACGYTNDIEELTTLQKPDMFFKFPLLGYQSSEKTDQNPPVSWNNLSIVVPAGSDSLEIQVWDKDNGPPFGSQDDLLATAKIKLGVGTFFWSDIGGLCTSGGITISDTIGSQFMETLDVVIGETPAVTLTSSLGDSICTGDTTLLMISGASGNTLTWFKDSVLLPGLTDSILPVSDAGTYWVEAISNTAGCRGISSPKTVSTFNIPPVPSLYFNTAKSQLYTVNGFGIPVIQWYKDNQLISGADTTFLTVRDEGYYQLEFINAAGCSEKSDSLLVQFSAIANVYEVDELIDVYPNPADGEITVKVFSQNNHASRIYILDAVGRMVRQDEINAQGVSEKHFDLRDLEPGIYFVKLMSAGNVATRKFLLF